MAVIKCKMCGGTLAITEGSTIAQCEYCGRVQTIPALDDEKKLIQFERAERLRKQCAFDKAAGIYETIVADYRQEAEAYWGLVLCKFGIEYVDDPATGKKIPTCHRSSFNSVMEDADFEQVLENADPAARKVYREEAKQIEELRKDILEVSKNEEPYDIFICYKETDSDGERTLDSVLAQDIYDALTEKNYHVFFSRITLEDKLGQEYEPYIFAALNSAKVMLAIGTDYEHFNAVWVRNEWSRYLELMEADKSKHLIPCFKGIDAYDMPKEFSKLQAQDLSKVGAIQDLLRGIDKLITPTVTAAPAQKSAEVGPLLSLGSEALEKGEWAIASNHFDLALTVNPMCAEAYLGKLMAERRCKKRSELAKSGKRLNKSNQYKQTIRYADETLKQELQEFCKKTVVRYRNRIITTISLAVMLLAAAVTAIEINYRNILDAFYDGRISAESTYQQLSQWHWYKKPDDCTQYLLEKAQPGSYPEANAFTSITIPDSVTSIGEDAFNGCSSLTSITIPDSVTSIGEDAFYNCTGLTSITIPDSVTSIGEDAFFCCTSLTSVTIPDSVTSIGTRAFYGCTSLTSITIPNSVTSIGEDAFFCCTSLTSVTIPDSVTRIEENAFNSCSSLTSVTIPNSVTSIGDGVFYRCGGLVDITIPDSVTSIGEDAFNDCSSLTSITIPNSVTSIGEDAFYCCTSLTSITIPDSVTSIGTRAFYGCTSLTSITIPDSVTSIGMHAFTGCANLTHIYCESAQQPEGWDRYWSRTAAEVVWGVTN